MLNFLEKKGGISIIGILIFGIIALLILNYFHISLKAIVENPTNTSNLSYLNDEGISLWNEYLKEPVNNLLSDFKTLFLQTVINSLEDMLKGKSSTIQNMAPQMPSSGQGQTTKGS